MGTRVLTCGIFLFIFISNIQSFGLKELDEHYLKTLFRDYEGDLNCLNRNTGEIPVETGEENADNRWSALDKIISAGMDCAGVPGMAVAVTKGNNVLYKKGFGFRDLTKNRRSKVRADTLFGIGSTSKAFTATFLAQLQSEGVFHWDDKVSDLYHKFGFVDDPNVANALFIDLMTHRTGVPRCDLLWAADAKPSTHALVDAIKYFPQSTPFRTGFGYNNFMANAAGQIGGWHVNSTWDEEISSRFFGPLGMSSATTSTQAAINSGKYAFPHGFNYENGQIEAYPIDVNKIIEPVGAAGSIVSSVDDMTKWTRFLTSGGKNLAGQQIVPQSSLEYTFVPQTVFPGSSLDKDIFPQSLHFYTLSMGWLQGEYGGENLLWHNGGTIGHATIVAFLPQKEISVIILSNSDTAAGVYMQMMFSAFDIALGRRPWINETTICTFPCPWACSSSLKLSQCAPFKTVEAESQRVLRNFKKVKTSKPSKDNQMSAEFLGSYSHPAFGTIDISDNPNSPGTIALTYGNVHCTQLDQVSEIFLLSCLEPFDLGSILRQISFGRSYNGEISKVFFDMEPSIPPIAFTKSTTYLPEVETFPRFVPTIPGPQ